MLFKDYHIPQIRRGEKTVTRREWADNYNPPTVGSVVIASANLFTSDEEADCYIRILDIYDQPLGEMNDEDAQKEGDYGDLEEFREGYEKVYGGGAWDPKKTASVVEFEYVGEERPTDDDQQTIATDGGTPTRDAIPEECQLCRLLGYRGDDINDPEGKVRVARDDGGTKIIHCCRRCPDELFTSHDFSRYDPVVDIGGKLDA